MNHLHSVFTKVYVREFYRQHAILFIIAIALLGGFMSGKEHIALASFFVSAPFNSLFPFTFWVLYFLKVIGFLRQAIRKKENEFAYHFILFSRPLQLKILMAVWLLLLMPVITYGAFLLLMAFRYQQEEVIILVIFYLILLVFSGLILTGHLLRNPNPQKVTGSIKRWIDKKFYKHYSLVIAESILRNHSMTFLIVKTGTLLLMSGVLFLYTTEVYDFRLLGMVAVVAFSGISPFILAMHQFENTDVAWIKNMPLTLFKRISYRFFCISLLCLPEIGILSGNFPENLTVPDLPLMLSLGLSLPVLYNGILFIKRMNPERFNHVVFYVSLMEVALVLFRVPITALILINTAAGFFLYKYLYYRYE